MEQTSNAPRDHGRSATGPSAPASLHPSTQAPASLSDSVDSPGQSPFNDGNDYRSAVASHGATLDPFATPGVSRPGSSGGTSALDAHLDEQSHRYFYSRRIQKGDIEKPWLGKKVPREKWVTYLPLIGIAVGLALSGILIWDGLKSVVKHKYCMVLVDDFTQGFRKDIWTKEVQVGGFGNGEFEETTADDENVFVRDGNLWIMPTLQDATLMEKDTLIDLLANGSCTSTVFKDCVAATNTTAGNSSVVPPTRSGRITTKGSVSIKYGRVEVTAKLPAGDWLWPAIWMMPVKDTYGTWPASGEMDIMESRGNNHTYTLGGNNVMASTLHWGPSVADDAWWRTNVKHSAHHTTFSEGFNTFGIEWSEKYIFTYVNSRLLQVLYTNFETPLWERGNFAAQSTSETYTEVDTVWAETGRKNTPFDQKFYLILNVAVGGTNGWFKDNKDGKPWLDASTNAPKDFWNARSKWYPTWKQPQMEVSKVEMWQQCDGSEDL
ncbi:gram-negative bacteria-binding protein [Grosmannia clavigera kw1407]|uniref:Gram-negative bacteria-binding protein n=1 Tax=Grosmannia clavigera (strain kw1407 / UAMH 11150) TaxID=655863 RepID=F0XKC7_GROCL|nr:gram-negative bacteria-binding protein [Grosmannia clavigera kw1407]EFX01881.1 gram-negative bacteria-binding protein [Grosmannia clavigera kw1407]